MSGYNSLDSADSWSDNGTQSSRPHPSRRSKVAENGDAYGHAAPHLYSTPVVSAPLITAFGLPTLVECEPPSSTADVDADARDVHITPPSPQFTSIQPHRRSLSLPVSPLSSREDQQGVRRRLRKSCTDGSSDHPAPTINAYTYRVRALSEVGLDEHVLRLHQNPDGTYSHAAAEQSDNMYVGGGELGKDDVPESDTGLLMSQDVKGSVSLDAVTGLEEAVATMDELPPHVHPSIPPEMLHPHFTQTAPPLKLWPLAVLVFYNVSGGPFGIEPSIRAAGNFYAILGFLIFPLIWSVPEALVTAELGAAFQDPSAGVAWVEEAFGEKMAYLCGILAWVSGATDNAIYPTLFMEYVSSVAGWDEEQFGGWARFASVAGITVCLAILNYTGLEIVGNASLVVCIIAMSPFVIMTVVGIPQVVPSRWFQMPEDGADALFDDDFQTSAGPLPLLTLGGVLWRPYLNNLFWNLNSFDSAGSFAGETTSASTTYPRGVFIGLALCVLAYIMPLLVAVGATEYSQADWVDGHLGAVAVDIGGKWLGLWTVFAAGISNLALFEAEMSSDAFQLMGMAERGYLPKVFTARSKYGTPTTGIIFNSCVIIAFCTADFEQLLELLNSVYAISLLMEYAAFVKLRLYHKELQRPYRIPIPDWAAVLLVMPPTAGILAVIAISNWYVYIFCVGALASGAILFKISEMSKDKGWFTFESKELRKNQHSMTPLHDEEIDGQTKDPLDDDFAQDDIR